MVREEGFEPSRPCGLGILSPVRLPFRHSRIYYLLPPTTLSTIHISLPFVNTTRASNCQKVEQVSGIKC